MSVRRPLLLPLVPLYAALVRWKSRLLERRQPKSLDAAVISVGSISAGGAGKTPMVLLLAEVLGRRGYAVRILTRGYGRGSKAVERVDPAGDAVRYGDEPLLLARRSGFPVYVGRDRYEAGRRAKDAPAGRTAVYLLDDGFQHRGLRRDLDIVLVTRKDLEDVMLPAGDLREPISALKRADVLVVREDEAAALHDRISRMMREMGPRPIWMIRRRLHLPVTKMPARPLVFCGIARPESFHWMLEAEGVVAAGTVAFRDHQRYGEREIARLLHAAKRRGADGFVTTEKDAVKLTAGMRARLEAVGALAVAELRVELVDEKEALEQMIGRVDGLDRRRQR